MNIHVKPSFNVAAYLDHVKATRTRLMRPANAVKQSRHAAMLQLVNRAAERPLWQRHPIQFNEHVKAWQWHLASLKANKYQEYIRKRCVELGVDFLQVIGDKQTRDVTGPRQLLMWELKVKFGLSYPRIGREFGRDHTTALAAVARISKIRGEARPECLSGEERLLRDPKLKAAVKAAYSGGATLEDLSVQFEISEKAISGVSKTENWPKPKRRSNLKQFKPVKVNMAMIRQDYEAGMTCKTIGLRHGISDRTVRRMVEKHGLKRASGE